MNKLIILVVILGIAGGFFFTKMKKDNSKVSQKAEHGSSLQNDDRIAVDVPVADKGPAIIKESLPSEQDGTESMQAVEEYAQTLPNDEKDKYLVEAKKSMELEQEQAQKIAKDFAESKKGHIKKSRDLEIEEKYQKSIHSRDANIAKESDGGSLPERVRSASSSSQIDANASARSSSLNTTPTFGGNNPVGN